MKEFDIESIGKRMPYSEPSDEIFARVRSGARAEAKRRDLRAQGVRRMAIAVSSIAAMVAVALGLNFFGSEGVECSYDAALDSYIATLSDADLERMVSEMEVDSEFYVNL